MRVTGLRMWAHGTVIPHGARLKACITCRPALGVTQLMHVEYAAGTTVSFITRGDTGRLVLHAAGHYITLALAQRPPY